MKNKIILPILAALGLLLSLPCASAQKTYERKSAGFRSPEAQEIHPWHGQNFHNQANNFQFAILADRTGGNVPGVFEQAIPKINLLQPEFVVSVGDIIDGYTENDSLIAWQWRDFEQAIAPLEMPLFLLPGNHDISNPRLRRTWEERYGRTYHHFIYNNVLFLMLNSEDPPNAKISAEQVDYYKKVIRKNTRVRWTLVFLHEPLWTYDDPSGYAQIESLLKGRPYTVFAGHTHHYRKTEQNGIRRYVVATTGGGTDGRGIALGEFHHLVWVTMTDSGPRLANLDVNGILPDDIVSDANYAQVQTLRSGAWFQALAAVSPYFQWQEIEAEIRFRNPVNAPMHIKADWSKQHGISFVPQRIDTLLSPETEWRARVRLSSPALASIDTLSFLALEATAAFSNGPGKTLAQPARQRLLLETRHPLPEKTWDMALDGFLKEWPEKTWISCSQPQQVQEDWDWKNSDDGWFRFAVACGDSALYVALQAFDDRLLFAPDSLQKNQDQFFLDLQSDAAAPHHIIVAPGVSACPTLTGIQAVCIAAENGLTAELRVPLAKSGTGKLLRLNVGYMDHDRPFSTKPPVLWWRPRWGGSLDYPDSGIFQPK